MRVGHAGKLMPAWHRDVPEPAWRLMRSRPLPPRSGVLWSLGIMGAEIRVRPRAAPATKIPSAYRKTGGRPRDSQRTSSDIAYPASPPVIEDARALSAPVLCVAKLN